MVILLLVIYAMLIAMWIELRGVKRELKEFKRLNRLKTKLTDLKQDMINSDVNILWNDFGKRLKNK